MRKELTILLVVAVAAVAFFVGRLQDPAPSPSPTSDAASVAAQAAPEPEPPPPTPAKVAVAPVVRHPARGPANARVTVVEISDFECPFCARGRATLEELRQAHADDVRVVFVHLPLAFHEHARPAAIASMAAHRQGKFWQLYERFFDHKGSLAPPVVLKYAREIGLDMAQFERDRADPAVAEQVADDTAIAASLGVSGTPAYFVNGVQISGAQPKEKVQAVLESQLAKADRALQSGAPRSKLHARMWRENNPAKADVAIDWIIRGRKPPKSARPKPQKGPSKEAEKPKKKAVHPAKDPTVWKVALRGDEPARGADKALVTAVLFTDFECPFCARVRPAIAQLEASFKGKLRLVFKNQPLSFHKRAPLAAEAGLCAHKQGKFWQMEEHLFTHQKELAPADLVAHAKAIGLKVPVFRRCLDKHETHELVQQDRQLAASLGVTGTPTLFINGRKVSGAQPFGVFARVVRQELDRAAKLLAGGAKPDTLYGQAIAQGKALTLPKELSDVVVKLDLTGSPRLGAADAPIQIAVFEDLQCPFCARLHDVLSEVRRTLGAKAAVVFKHLPLSSQCNPTMGRDMHPAACRAAAWAMAAEEQQVFWAFTKRVFADMRGLMPKDGTLEARLTKLDENLMRHAKLAGVDLQKAAAYLSSRRYETTIRRDIGEAARFRVRGTPSVYLNGRAYNGPLSAERIAAAARRALKPPPAPKGAAPQPTPRPTSQPASRGTPPASPAPGGGR